MNTDILSGNWKQLSGKVKQQWGKFTDDDISRINGRAEELEGLLQEKYGYSKDEAQNSMKEFYDKYKENRE